jgi:four helix bundle protein
VIGIGLGDRFGCSGGVILPAGRLRSHFGSAKENEMAALQVAELSFELIEALGPLIPRIKLKDKALADQLSRAATSVALNIAEGEMSHAGNRRLRFFSAAGSANESLAALRIAVAWRYVAAADAERALSFTSRICAMLWRLTH